MNTFAKIFIVAVVAALVLKFSPLFLFLAFVGVVLAAVLGTVGFSLAAALVAVLLAFAVALSPIWIPVLVVVGIIGFLKGHERPTPPAPV